jgi:hypothetical protein
MRSSETASTPDDPSDIRVGPGLSDDKHGEQNAIVSNSFTSAAKEVAMTNLPWVMEGFDQRAKNLQLTAIRTPELDTLVNRWRDPAVSHLEPPAPTGQLDGNTTEQTAPFDFVCLTRSPPHTPETTDPLFDQIRTRFIVDAGLA